MLFSAVISPCRNGAAFLERCVQRYNENRRSRAYDHRCNVTRSARKRQHHSCRVNLSTHLQESALLESARLFRRGDSQLISNRYFKVEATVFFSGLQNKVRNNNSVSKKKRIIRVIVYSYTLFVTLHNFDYSSKNVKLSIYLFILPHPLARIMGRKILQKWDVIIQTT